MADSTEQTFLIEGIGVGKVFKDFWGRTKVTAVRGVDIQVRQGSVFGLLGPNGAGKSTIMKLILGHLYPTSGNLAVFGKPPTDVSAKSRLGYLPERAYLYKNLNPMETLRFFGEILELPRGEVDARSEQLLEMVGLEHAKQRLVGEFSHGMMRRMGLAQALLNDPDLLLLDEPTAGLDPIGCREVKNLILTLARRGKTILLTSHLLADVEDVCDQVLIMYGGRALASGEITDLLADRSVLQVRLPAPGKDTMERLRTVLGGEVDLREVEFSSPTRSLENYFLEVIRKASQTEETHGAQLGKGVASYLREGVEETEETLEVLSHGRRAAVPSAPAADPEQAVDEDALGQLAADDTRPESQADDDEDDDIDASLLDDLTKGKP